MAAEENEQEAVPIFYGDDDSVNEYYEDADDFEDGGDGSGEDFDDDDDVDGDGDFDDLKYLIVRPEQGGVRDLFKYGVRGDIGSGLKFLDSSDEGLAKEVASDHRWIITVSIIARKIIAFFRKPLEWIGFLVDFVLNLLSDNGELCGLICNILLGKVVIPQRGTENFVSTIGHLDGRIDLYKSTRLVENTADFVMREKDLKFELGDRALVDLCIMASKLAYENANIIRNVVVQHWKMSTQVFVLSDKPKDAKLILISFRGTEPFDADDWGTDFDYSWYEIPNVGKIHMGFLEAIGLGNRAKAVTFPKRVQWKNTKATSSSGVEVTADLAEGPESKSLSTNFGSKRNESDRSSKGSSGEKLTPPDMVKRSAYYVVRRTLRSLLKKHKNAKFVVTGHSLGGALAIMFPTVLVLREEKEMMQKLLGVYTFGQPRIVNKQLARFMEAHLSRPVPRYFRVVYCNDIVPRLPYDDKTFLYKHFGVCLYHDSCYNEMRMHEEPNPNYFGLRFLIPGYLNSIWELVRSLTVGCLYGPEYKEGWFSILLRVLGLALPGISAHSPRDYVNSIRLGSQQTIQMSPF